MSIPDSSSGPTSADAWPAALPAGSAANAARAAVRSFQDRFGATPVWLAVAPGRVNLIGEHTDYNGGYVLPLAIDRHVAIAAGPAAAGRRLRVWSAALETSVDIPTGGVLGPGEPSWANYLRGVVSGFVERGFPPPPIDLAIVSRVPLGGGLSSSAALEVATATVLEGVTGQRLDPRDKARLCRQAEHEFAGVPCGLMDQFASVLGDEGGALLIDCQFEVVRLVPFADRSVSILISNTNVKHALADGAYLRRRTECIEAARQLGVPSLRDATPEMVEQTRGIFDPVVRRRARHVTTENVRTLAAAEHLEAREFAQVGALMYESHRSLRDDFEVSSAELDTLVDIACEIGEAGGVLGARMTGGGFGGCTVTLVRTESVSAVTATLTREYQRRTGRAPSIFVSRPARGAHLVDISTLD
jgi:galactokinase